MDFKPNRLLSTMLTCLVCYFPIHASTNSQLFPTMETDALITSPNCVNVINGDYCESTIDLQVHADGKDSDGIFLERVFGTTTTNTGELVDGWRILPQLFLVQESDKTNSSFFHEVVLANGTKRIYEKVESIPTQLFGQERLSRMGSQVKEPEYFRLVQETLPTSKQIDYTFDTTGSLNFIELKNTQNQVLAWMHFSHQEDNNGYRLKVITSDNNQLEYTLTHQNLSDGSPTYALSHKRGGDEGACHFLYEAKDHGCRLVKKEFQDGRSVDIAYDNLGRVKTLSLSDHPVGPSKQQYHFHYDQGFTDVVDASGKISRYETDAERVLSQTLMDSSRKVLDYRVFKNDTSTTTYKEQAPVTVQAKTFIETHGYSDDGLNVPLNAKEQKGSQPKNSYVNLSNIAPMGKAYGWSGMSSSTANNGQVAQPGLNDNNLTTDIDIQPNGDKVGSWEAAGIIWSSAANITSVNFINGSVTRDGDGFLTANCKLQFSFDGTTWTDSGWKISPSYPNSSSANGKTYTFSGSAVSGVMGARVVGQVRTKDTSYHWIVKEVRVIGSIGSVTTFAITASAGGNGSISPSGNVSTAQGSNQSFTITPASGFVIASVIVDGMDMGPIGTYTFSNIQANHSISATFKTGTTTCTTPPAVPTGLNSPSQTSSSVNLSWNPVGIPSGCQVTYNVYNGNTLAATVPNANAVITGLSANTTYTFTVSAKDAAGASAPSSALAVKTATSGNYTPEQILAAIQSHMTSSVQVNSLPHINTMTRAMNVNVYEVSSGVFAYTSSMAIDTDGSDPDPDPDHQNQTTWQDSSGAHLGAHHVPFYVLGDDCWDKTTPCKHFFYKEHNIKGRQFALIFYKGKVIGSIFGDTQTGNQQTTSDNDSRELGEASVAAASMLGIPSSGTTGGVNNGVTVVIFSGPDWVIQGTNQGTGPVGSATGSLNGNAQALVQKALNTLGSSFGL